MKKYGAQPRNILKGGALKRRLRDIEMSQQALASSIQYKSHGTIAVWCRGVFWPTRLELLLEERVQAPKGFFEQIAQGVPYEQALNPDAYKAPAPSPPAMSGLLWPVVFNRISSAQYGVVLDILKQILHSLEVAQQIAVVHERGQEQRQGNGATVLHAP